MSLNEIKIELFDKCHNLVYEYMKLQAKHDRTWIIKNEDEFHTRHGELVKQVFFELAGDSVSFYLENSKQIEKLNLK